MPDFVTFECPCGKTLRAGLDRVGTPVRCWACHAENVVPSPAAGGRLGRELLDAVRGAFRFENVLRALAGGLIVSCLLMVPVAGTVLGLAAMAIAASAYPGALRGSRVDAPTSPRFPGLERPRDLAWGAAIVLGIAGPSLVRHLVMDRCGFSTPGAGAIVAAVASVGWLTMPIGPLLDAARDRPGPDPGRRVRAAIRRHPVAPLIALLALPAGLAALEMAAVGISIHQEWFPFLILDLFPLPGIDRIDPTKTSVVDVDPSGPTAGYLRIYARGLRLGYSLIGAIPASLWRGRAMRAVPWFIFRSPWEYPEVRVLGSTLILAGTGLILEAQARWLGRIVRVDDAASRPSEAGGLASSATPVIVLDGLDGPDPPPDRV